MGGSIVYTWQTVPFVPGNDVEHTVSRALQTRTVNPGDGQPARTWTYHWYSNVTLSYGFPQAQFPVWAVTTDSQGNDVERQLGGGNLPVSTTYYQGCSPHDTAAGKTCNAASPVLLKSEAYTYAAFGGKGASGTNSISGESAGSMVDINTTTTTMPGSGGSAITRAVNNNVTYYGTCTSQNYDTGGENPQPDHSVQVANCNSIHQPVSQAVDDYGSSAPGPSLRTTATTYQWQVTPSYLTANLMSLPGAVQVADGLSGATVSKVIYGYDEANGSPQGVFGNNTSITKGISGETPVKTATVYNAAGNVTASVDANSNPTTYTYTDAHSSLPTTVTGPPTSGHSHVTSAAWDDNTGVITSRTDETGVTSTYTYNDPLGRMSQMLSAVGTSKESASNYTYPSLTQVHVQQDQAVLNDQAIGTNQISDDLGEVTQSVDASGAIRDMTFDSRGNLASLSNPHFTTSSGSDGITGFAYDALNRKIRQCNPDNGSTVPCNPGQSFQQWSYSGNIVLFADEAGIQRQQVYDGLGRLKQITELGSAADPRSLTTNYGYDALGNLLSVSQLGTSSDLARNRRFLYDSRSRLTASCNPELVAPGTTCDGTHWSATYSYDGNGNVLTKIAAGKAVSYGYDTLNRLTAKSYSDGTPSACFRYDARSSGPGVAYSSGRLVSEWTQAGACVANGDVPASAITTKTILAYDPLGRVISEQQCAVGSCATPYPVQHAYNLLGSTTMATNGDPTSGNRGIAFTYNYDSGNRLSSVTSTWDDAAHPAAIFKADATIGTPPYGPVGITAAQLGVITATQLPSFTQSRIYDNRERITAEATVGKSAAVDPLTPVLLSLSPATNVSLGVTPLYTTTCDAACGTGGGRIQVDDQYVSGFTYYPGAQIAGYLNTALTVGTHTIQSIFGGDGTHPPASSAPISFTVVPAYLARPSLIATPIVISPTPIPLGESATLTVTNSCASACGQAYYDIDNAYVGVLEFDDNGVAGNSIPSTLNAGTHNLTVHYYGDGQFQQADSGNVPFIVKAESLPPMVINIAVGQPLPTDEYGTATITLQCGSSCRGGQYYIDGSYAGGYVPNASGSATVSLNPGLSVATHTMTATYPGDAAYGPATSQPQSFQVVADNLPKPVITVTQALPFPAGKSSPFAFTVIVSGVSCGGIGKMFVDGGYVASFYVDNTGAGNSQPFTVNAGAHQMDIEYYGTTACHPAHLNPYSFTAK